jgi:CRISPR-associated protein Cas2
LRHSRIICHGEAQAVNEDRLIIVTYDIGDAKRWRRVFKLMHGYGEWLQLSVFQCRLSPRRRAELVTRLRELVKAGEDHVLLMDVGPADRTSLAVESIGKSFAAVERRAIVI